MPRYIDVDAVMRLIPMEEFVARMAIANAPTADVVERKDLDTITEAHEQIGYEKGYRDGYAQANVVEVVRCKECKWSDTFSDITAEPHSPLKCLGIRYGGVNGDWFCEHGERRTDDAELH